MRAICGVASARPDLSRTGPEPALLDWYGHCVVRAGGGGGGGGGGGHAPLKKI